MDIDIKDLNWDSMGKRQLVVLPNLSSWCLVVVEWRFLAVPWGCLRFVIVVFHDHTHLLFRVHSGHIINLRLTPYFFRNRRDNDQLGFGLKTFCILYIIVCLYMSQFRRFPT